MSRFLFFEYHLVSKSLPLAFQFKRPLDPSRISNPLSPPPSTFEHPLHLTSLSMPLKFYTASIQLSAYSLTWTWASESRWRKIPNQVNWSSLLYTHDHKRKSLSHVQLFVTAWTIQPMDGLEKVCYDSQKVLRLGSWTLVAQLVKNLPAVQETPVQFLVGKIPWRRNRLPTPVFLSFPCSSAGKESACNVGDLDWIPELGRSPGEGKGYPLQYSGLDCIVDGVAKSWTQLSHFHFHLSRSLPP